MKYPSTALHLTVLLDAFLSTSAARIQAHGHSIRSPFTYDLDSGSSSNSLNKRAQAIGSKGTSAVSNNLDTVYLSTVTVGGVDVDLQIDTGR